MPALETPGNTLFGPMARLERGRISYINPFAESLSRLMGKGSAAQPKANIRAATFEPYAGALEPPGSLGLASAMTPLQQRTAIATRGLADSAALDYYRKLVRSALVTPKGGIVPQAEVMPIEWTYLGQTLGRPTEQRTPESFLTELLRP